MMSIVPNIRLLVLFGPSGSGKSTLVKRLISEFPNSFGHSVSHTTRDPRPSEINGIHYHFITKNQMISEIQKGNFIETTEYVKNLYGTSKMAVKDVLDSNKVCILDIDMVGVQTIKKTDLNPFVVFIKPPSLEILYERLKKRGTEKEIHFNQRIELAEIEINFGLSSKDVDCVIENDDLEIAYQKLKDLIFPSKIKS